MIPFARVEARTPSSRMVGALYRRLGVPRSHAVGVVTCLWCWACTHREDGDLSGLDDFALADACCWDGDPALLREALLRAGAVEEDEGGMRLSGWMDEGGTGHQVLTGREKARKRKARWRERQGEQEELPLDEPEAKPKRSKPKDETPVVLELPCKGQRKTWALTEAKVTRLATTFDVPPAFIVERARRAMAWLDANPSRRATEGGTLKFLTRWIGKDIDDGKAKPTAQAAPPRYVNQADSARARAEEAMRRAAEAAEEEERGRARGGGGALGADRQVGFGLPGQAPGRDPGGVAPATVPAGGGRRNFSGGHG